MADAKSRVVLTFEVDDSGVVKGLGGVRKRVETETHGISAKAVAFGAAIGTAVGKLAIDALQRLGEEFRELALRGIELAPVVQSFDALALSIGTTGDEMLAVSRSATRGLIADLDLMAAANKAIQLGLPVTAESFGDLARMATVLGRAMNQDATKSVEDLVVALGRQSPLILDNLGLTVRISEANEKYAKTLGKTAADLTDAERKMAFYHAALEAGRQASERLGGIQLTLADRLTIARNQVSNFTDSLSVAVATSPVINAAMEAIGEAIGDAMGENRTELVQKLIGYVNQFAISAASAAEWLVQGADWVVRAWYGIEVVVKAALLAVLAFAEGANSALLKTVEWVNAVPGVRGQFDGLAASMRDNVAFLSGMRQGMQEQVAEAWEGFRGNSALSQALQGLGERITAIKGRMIEASRAQVDARTIQGQFRQELEETGDTAGMTADQLKKLEQQAEKERQTLRSLGIVLERDVTEQLDQFARAISRAGQEGVPLNVVLSGMIPKLRELIAKAKASGQNVDALVAKLHEMRTTVRELNGGIPPMTARLLSVDEAMQTMVRSTGLVTAEQIRARTESALLASAYETLGITTEASLRKQADEARLAYQRIAESGQATERELTEAWARVELAELDAGLRTISTWETEVVPAIQSAGGQIVGSMTANFSEMLTGAVSFKDGFVAIWNDLKTTLKGILEAMLRSFLNDFLGGMLSGLQGWAQQAGKIIGQALSVGGASAAVSSGATAAGAGSGASAAGAAGLGSVAAFAAGAAAPFVIGSLVNPDGVYTSPEMSAQWEIDALMEGIAYLGITLDEAIARGLADGLSWDAKHLLGLGDGGIVMPQPDGVIARLAEAGQPELVAPLPAGFDLRDLAEPSQPMVGHVYLDGRELIRSGVVWLPDEADRLGAFVR